MKKKFILLAMMLLALIGGVNLNVLNAQTQYRVKFTTLNQYLTIFNNTSNPSGPVGGVGVDVYQESNAQKFTIETGANGGVYLKSADGYYIYCNGGSGGWNVDAINGSDKSELYGFDMNGGSFKIYDDNGYIKVQEVNSAYYIFHDASYAEGASWQLVEVIAEDDVIPGAPTDLAATEIAHNYVTLSWTAGTDALKYNVYRDGSKIADKISGTTYKDETVQPKTTYKYTVESVRFNDIVSTTHSNEVSVTTSEAPANDEITVGDGTTTDQYIPINTYYNYSITQQIYTAEILGFSAGTISSIQFNNTTNNRCYERNIDVYMVNTDKESFSSSTDWVTVTEDDIVYSGTHYFDYGFTEITFTKKFEYDGKNILICVDDNSGTWKSRPSFAVDYTDYNSSITTASDTYNYDPSGSISSNNDHKMQAKVNQVIFTWESPAPSVTISEKTIAFGSVKVGDEYWSEKPEPSFDVNVTAKNTTIASISCDNDFFTFTPALSGAAEQTEFNFTVSYDKEAEAGEKTGTITVKYMDGEEEKSETISLSATAYVPAEGDVIEKAKTVAFTDGSYTDNATDMYDDYILPGEENDGSNGDAVYAFSLTEDAVITADVEGTNGIVAIYKKEVADAEGIKADNNDTGITLDIVQTADSEFTFDFEDIVLEDHFTLVEYDGNDNHWQIINDYTTNSNTIISYSFTYGGINTADNYIITKEVYNITATSTLTMDAKCGGQDGGWDEVMVKVSTNGEEFTLIQTVKPESKQWVNGMTIDLGAKFAELGLSYGNYHIALHHKNNYIYSIQVDNLKLSDGSAKSRSMARSEEPQINAVQYSAGDYYLVAAAEGNFTLNLSTGTIPAPEAVTYTFANNATEQDNPKLTWTYGEYATEYQVLLGTSENLTEDDVVVDWTSPLATSYQTKDLQNNTKYYWQVNVKNATGTTNGEVYSFVTPLDVPQNVTATATELYQDNNTTTISWTEMEGLTYNVYVNGEKHNDEPLTEAKYVLSNLDWNPEGHSVTVRAIHGELGESTDSEAAIVKVAGTFTFTVNVKDAEDNAIKGATVELTYLEGAIDEFGNQLTDVYETVMTNESGMVEFKNVKLLGDWATYYYEIKVTKDLYQENIIVINNDAFSHGHNEEVDVDMSLMTIYFEPSAYNIYFGESVTLTWEPIGAENVTYNVYVNGEKHNTEAIAGTTYVISDLPYNINGGNEVAVTAVHSLGETPQDPIYVKVAGTFTLTVNVTDGTNTMAGVDIVIKTLNSTTDEFGNAIEDVTGLTTDENGQVVVPNMKVMKNGESGYMYQIIASKEFYTDGYENIVNYSTYYGNPPANGDNVEKTIKMQMVAPQNITSAKEYYIEGEDVVLTWEAPDFNTRAFLGYNVYQITNYGEDETKLNEEPLTETSYTITGLEYGSYNFGVSAVYDEGESSNQTTFVKVTGYSEITGFVKDDNNEPIKGVSITVEGYNEFDEEVTYTATSDANGAFSIENVMLSSYEGYTLTATKFDYQEKVVPGIEVVYNTPTQCDVTMQTLPGGTFAVTASEVGENVEVTWDVPTGGVAYNVYRRFDGDVTPLTTEEITTQPFTDETWSTLADGEYEYGVSAKIAQGLNITEDFEDGIPSTWAVYNKNGTVSNYDWKTTADHTGNGNQAAISNNNNWGSDNYFYMVTQLLDLTEVTNPRIIFDYYTPYYSSGYTHYTNTLSVKVLTEGQGQSAAVSAVQVWSNNTIYTTNWTNHTIDLSGYVGQKIYVVFESRPYEKYGRCTSIDNVQITSDATTYTTGVSWADPITKGGIEFLATADGNWNVGSNWSTGEVPSATDKVTIKGNAVITENVNINTITIADGASLTLESGVLTAEIINNKNAQALVIEDGAQLFQNNNNVAATFKMGITTPQQWSNANQDGWQFIASPFTNAEMSSFIPSEGEYDLYKYDGTKDLEWVNHKAAQGGDEFSYNFDNGVMPAEFTQIDADGDGNEWYHSINNNTSLGLSSDFIGSEGCLYSSTIVNYSVIKPENYLILPKSKVVDGSVLTFKARSYYYEPNYNYCEHFEVLVSKSSDIISDFVSVTGQITDNGNNWNWKDYTVDLSGYADEEIYIAICHNTDTQYASMLMLDDLQLVSAPFTPFDEEFVQGRGYLASYETLTSVELAGNLYNASSFTWNELSYSAEKDLANFHLLGNPFTFDMDVTAATYNNLVEGVAIVNNEGGYTYDVTTIPVGDGFFVKATGENPTLSYDAEAKATRGVKANSLNVIATSNAGKDNVVINLGGEKAGFNKLQNFNDAIATVYVQDNGANYGIYNCNADVQEIELNFNANQMGNYTLSIQPNGKFQTVTLVDRFTGIETNMLVEDYHFTAMSNVNTNRFIIKMVNGQQTTDNSHFVFQSGEDLIIDAEGTVQIIDVMGRVLVSDEVESTNNRINVSGFQNGTYMVRVINGSEVKVEKVVIY